jgi:D-lactate dehydrogenase (cytochrome)
MTGADRIALLRAHLPPDVVEVDAATLRLYASDIFWLAKAPPIAVLSPRNEAELCATMRAASAAGVSANPRGAGMSYTKGYVPDDEATVIVDLRRMDRVLEVNVEDGYAHVEAGCTWAALHKALAGTDWILGAAGPFSGLLTTIGGAASQNSAGFGASRWGTVGDSVIGLTLVLPDGTLVRTGAAARRASRPFSRTNGPDLTGLFLGDNGAFGIKATVALRLRRRPPHVGFAAYGLPSLGVLAQVQCELARREVVTSGYGFDQLKADLATRGLNTAEGARLLLELSRSQDGIVAGVWQATRVAATGTSFLREHPFTLHLIADGLSRAEVDAKLEIIKGICSDRGCAEIPTTVPRLLHARPFGPLRGMLGPDGERWVPVHALFPLSDAQRAVARWEALRATWQERLDRLGIMVSLLTMTVGLEFFLEPAFYWRDELLPIHAEALGAKTVASWASRSAAPEARDAVASLRRETQELFAGLGGISWQVARDYPFRNQLHDGSWELLARLKAAIDPANRVNPGVLGLERPDGRA